MCSSSRLRCAHVLIIGDVIRGIRSRSTQAADAVGEEERERKGGRVLSCLDSLAVPLHQKQPEPSFINNIATSMAK